MPKYITLEELMKRINPHMLIEYTAQIGSVRASHGKIYSIEFLKQLRGGAAWLETEAERIGLPVTKDAAHALVECITSKPDDNEALNIAVTHLQKTLHSELKAQVFLQLEPNKVSLAFEPHQFGEQVDSAFPSATWDIEEASRCLAFDRGTACVFHLMKVLEVGLYLLSAELKIEKIKENWNNAIEQILKEIRLFEQNKPDKNASKGEHSEWKAKLQFYSDCATHFRLIKDAWRNQTTHTRRGTSPYTEEKAEQIYDNVRGFMQVLATRLREQP